MRAFPPRLPEQPIFYPVLTEEYAVKIARDWNVPASGKGKIYSFSVMERANPPYAAAYITLAEGPTMLTNIVDCDFKALKIQLR